jgi:hypothetical protein
MSNVVELDVASSLPIPAERILNRALGDGLDTAVVIGWDDDGQFYFASSNPDGGDILWLLEYAKKALLP